MIRKVHASPTKDFFVNMITRDISLSDCVLDLLDNSVDGARNYLALQARRRGHEPNLLSENLNDFSARILFEENRFSIEDNCGGIPIRDAIEYAFHFGRVPQAPQGVEGTIGIYGIGMKRAVLKMGKSVEIRSSTEAEAFEVRINVEEWLEDTDEWDFDLEEIEVREEPGTTITVTDLYEQIGAEFKDNVFQTDLKKIIARDYAFILKSGFRVFMNESEVLPYNFELRESDSFKPVKISYTDNVNNGDIRVEIVAGMADAPSDRTAAEDIEDRKRRETEYYGWYVVCNNRVVLAADQTNRTVWGDEGFASWHPQYNGFIGIVKFTSQNPLNLPWRTTKRDVDESNPVYRRAIVKMKEVTSPWTSYTTARKRNLSAAKNYERVTVARPIEEIEGRARLELPKFTRTPRVKMARIEYTKPQVEVDEVKRSIGRPKMSNPDVGRYTFDYYREREVTD